MTEDALTAALARLDRAVARAEHAIVAGTSGQADIAEAYTQLDERHDLLRSRIHEIIARLDAMIDGAG